MYVTIDNTVQALYTLTRELKRSPILRRYSHQSSHTGTGLRSQSPWTLESDL